MYKCYIAISRVCAEKISHDKDLKTQICFGSKDIEIFTKIKWSGEGYKIEDLSSFMEDVELLVFDNYIQWKKRDEKTSQKET